MSELALALEDRAAWQAAPRAAQDAALEAAARALGPAFTLEGAADVACAGLAHRVGVLRHARTGLALHLVPGGAFTAGRAGGADAEGPLRPARCPPLLMARTPVTRGAWDAVAGPLAGHGPRGPDDAHLPVGGVSWAAARAWLARAGDGLRLPCEAEWEWCARAGAATAFFWGDAPDPRFAWVQATAGGRPHDVREHDGATNAFGLVDVAGNVAEWCADDHAAPMEGSAWHEWDPGKALRGGSHDRPWAHARSAWRAGADPRAAWPDLGLRPVVDLPGRLAGRAS